MINGKRYDWEDVTVILPSGEAVEITDINYSDGQQISVRYGKGSTPRGYGRQNYEASGSMTLDLEEWERLVPVLGGSGEGSIYDHIPFPIIVSYGGDSLSLTTDTLPLVKINKVSTSNSQGNENAGAKAIEFTVLKPILYNGIPAKI